MLLTVRIVVDVFQQTDTRRKSFINEYSVVVDRQGLVLGGSDLDRSVAPADVEDTTGSCTLLISASDCEDTPAQGNAGTLTVSRYVERIRTTRYWMIDTKHAVGTRAKIVFRLRGREGRVNVSRGVHSEDRTYQWLR